MPRVKEQNCKDVEVPGMRGGWCDGTGIPNPEAVSLSLLICKGGLLHHPGEVHPVKAATSLIQPVAWLPVGSGRSLVLLEQEERESVQQTEPNHGVWKEEMRLCL